MADFNNLFSIEDTQTLGNLEAAEAFLSGDPITDTEGIKSLEDVKKEAEAKKKAEEEAKRKAKEKAEKEKREGTKTETEDKVEDAPVDPFAARFEDEEKGEDELTEEDLKEEEEEEDTEKEEGKDKSKEKEDNQFELLSKDLFKLGVFTEQEGEEKIETPEQLLSRFQMEGQMKATQWLDGFLSQFGDDRREMFEAIYINGVDPADYVPVFNEVQNFKGMDLTNEDNQKKVFREFYKRIGMDPEKVEKRLQKTIDYGELEDEVTDLHEKIVSEDDATLQELSTQKKAQTDQKKKLDDEYKVGLQKILNEGLKAREFKGVPITEKKAREAYDFLYTPKYKTANGQLLTDFDKFILETRKPENLEQRVLLALLKLDNFSFSAIEKKAVSKETNQLFTSLAQKVTKDKSRVQKNVKSSSTPWMDL